MESLRPLHDIIWRLNDYLFLILSTREAHLNVVVADHAKLLFSEARFGHVVDVHLLNENAKSRLSGLANLLK